MAKIFKLPLQEKPEQEDISVIVNPYEENAIDKNGNHYIKNSPEKSKENWRY